MVSLVRQSSNEFLNICKEFIEGNYRTVVDIGLAGDELPSGNYKAWHHPRVTRWETLDYSPVFQPTILFDLCSSEWWNQGVFDLVICSNTLEHCRDWELAIRNLSLMVAEGGYLLIDSPCSWETCPAHGTADFGDYHRLDAKQIMKEGELHGLIPLKLHQDEYVSAVCFIRWGE